MEGFICPECRQILQSPEALEGHFSEHLNEGTGFKSMLSRAKDYTLNLMGYEEGQGGTTGSTSSVPSTSSSPVLVHWSEVEEQTLGRVYNHTKVFRAIRPKKMSHSVKEANKLLIRLDKLISAVIADIGTRSIKDIEKSIVPWLNDSNECIGCGSTLSIVSRKHHCRLCTGILCTNCSMFVPLEEAILALGKPLPESLPQHDFRFCEKCLRIVDSAKEEVRAKSVDKTMENDYTRLADARAKCEKLMHDYRNVAKSLRNGESVYTLERGNTMRVELIKQFRILDKLSERIAGINTSSPTQLKVQTNIRQSVRGYLQDNLAATAPLPEQAEITALQEKRVQEAKRAEQRQKEEALRYQATVKRTVTPQNVVHADSWNTKSRKTEIARDMARDTTRDDSGWSGVAIKPEANAHPLIEQREILRGYLRQAMRDNRTEEVDALKQSLHHIVDEINLLGLES